MKDKIIQSIKQAFQSVRIVNIRPTGVLATRGLVLIMLVPILLVVVTYVLTFLIGHVSEDKGKLITVGITIIDHIFIPSVLTALVGFLALWIDKDGNGIPDKLENTQNTPIVTTSRKSTKRNYDERCNYERD